MKVRMILLLTSLFALTPAILGSAAWGGENRGKNGSKQECELLESKRFDPKSARATAQPAPATGQTQAN